MLPYLEGLAAVGHRMHLLTFETTRMSAAGRREVRRGLAGRGVEWHSLRYHKRPSLPATAADAAVGAVVAGRLIDRHHLDLVHARSHVPAAMGLAVRRRTGCGFLFDIRGLLAEEYVDAGTWREGGLPFRLTKSVERASLGAADGVVVLTDRGRRHLFDDRQTTRSGAPVAVIPTCADTSAIANQAPERPRVRARLGLGSSPVVVYLGKFGSWYMEEELARFFSVGRTAVAGLRLLVISQSDTSSFREALAHHHVPDSAVVTIRVPPHEIGAHLAAADMAVSFIRDSPSKLASSPTKIGEYLAAGLPVLVSPGVGDTDALIIRRRVGVVLPGHDEAEYVTAISSLQELARDPTTGARCRAAAQAELSLSDVGVPRYQALYEEIEARIRRRRHQA